MYRNILWTPLSNVHSKKITFEFFVFKDILND